MAVILSTVSKPLGPAVQVITLFSPLSCENLNTHTLYSVLIPLAAGAANQICGQPVRRPVMAICPGRIGCGVLVLCCPKVGPP